MKAQKDESQIKVSSVDDEIGGKLSINPVKTETRKSSATVSNSNQVQLTNSNSKNTLHVRNEIADVVPCKKAKLLRIERKKNKLLAQGKSQSEIESIMKEKKQQNCIKTMEEFFEEVYTGLKKLEVMTSMIKLQNRYCFTRRFLILIIYGLAFFILFYMHLGMVLFFFSLTFLFFLFLLNRDFSEINFIYF